MNAVKLFAIAALLTTVAAGSALARGPHHHGGMGGPDGCGGRDKPLTATQVKDIVEGKIAWRGEDLTVSQVEEKGEAFIVSVAKPDGSTIRKMQVDKKTGRFQPVE